MAVYTTGRTRTLTFESEIGGSFLSTVGFLVPPVHEGDPPWPDASSELTLEAWGATIVGQSLHYTPPGPVTIPPGPVYYGYEVLVNTGLGDSDLGQYKYEFWVPSPLPQGPFTFAWQPKGRASFTLDVEEVIEIADGADFPSYGGSRANDPPVEAVVRLKERARIGGKLQVSAFWGEASASAETEITSENQFDVASYALSHSVAAASLMMGGYTYARNSTFNGVHLGAPGYSVSDAHHSATAESGASVTTSPLTVDPFTGSGTVLTTSQSPPRTYALDFALRAMEGAYPETLGLKVDRKGGEIGLDVEASGGGLSDFCTQYQFSASASFTGTPVEDPAGYENKNEYAPFRMWCRPGSEEDDDPYSLYARGEEPSDWRILLRGTRYASASAGQVASYSLDSGGSLSPSLPKAGVWEDVENTSVSVDSGAIKAEVSGGSGKLHRTYDPDRVSLAGYRYLRVKIKADSADRGFRVRLGEKEWTADWQGTELEGAVLSRENAGLPSSTATSRRGRR